MMCAQRGYPCVITMAEPFSIERRKLMRMLGARVIVTPKAGKGTGMVEKAQELAEKNGWFLCHQFETDANWKFHYETTVSRLLCICFIHYEYGNCTNHHVFFNNRAQKFATI